MSPASRQATRDLPHLGERRQVAQLPAAGADGGDLTAGPDGVAAEDPNGNILGFLQR